MTDHAQPVEHDEPHEGPIRTRKALVLTLFWAHVVPIFGIILLVIFVVTELRPGAGSDNLNAKATALRIAPVGRVEVKDASDIASLKTGEQVFQAQCSACHATGAAGAPKVGDAAAWGPRIATGFDALLHSALTGKGAMTPQGGGDFSDLEIARAVVYMANQGGGKFEEPKAAPAATTTAKADTGAAGGDAGAAAAAAQAAMANVAKANAAATPAAATGAAPALFTQVCQACHATGVAGAPKLGDKAAWAPRLTAGIDGMTAIAIQGKGAMPPRGGTTASDAEIKAVVTYMANAAK
jgi:cytochrome c5